MRTSFVKAFHVSPELLSDMKETIAHRWLVKRFISTLPLLIVVFSLDNDRKNQDYVYEKNVQW